MHLGHFTTGTAANSMPRQLKYSSQQTLENLNFFFYFSKSTVGLTYRMHIYTFFSENASWATVLPVKVGVLGSLGAIRNLATCDLAAGAELRRAEVTFHRAGNKFCVFRDRLLFILPPGGKKKKRQFCRQSVCINHMDLFTVMLVLCSRFTGFQQRLMHAHEYA